ncbi:TIR domain-containing protein [Legionella pneumophila]|uniref:ABC-type sugar transport system, periplasmic component n=1 Tax=Legionella pneumophila subsp. pascullei TaxID=91890 RepID=A0AAX2IZ38_LEGPN|nr:nucleotide-binding protein [Legionella pneumophila]AMP89078.1 hypothetical protein AXF35_05010 [Legionella pneumophila subsp. pascullei]AMP93255.1 hypothetical protein AXF36_11785 [Legionella pneumophila subsp. pascullei]AMP96221.1 hypothetical protein AXF37_11675 [Legionella pneumophila subsp. pascullei]SQG91171.1 ABC-type sugar transport system, periplasmic component [Legionella pneumophila subsp. pascullei]VEH07717.1 ABC-type sugar transport system, periplasmic component [Legionella pneu
MKKNKRYERTKFPSNVIIKCIDIIKTDLPIYHSVFSVSFDNEEWEYDSFDEYVSDYNKDCSRSSLLLIFQDEKSTNRDVFNLNFDEDRTRISFESNSRDQIIKIFNIFEENAKSSLLPESKNNNIIKDELVVYIGHGHDQDWKIVKEELQDKHNIKIEAYETGARAGHTIRDVLEDMSNKSHFAILVFTGEDVQKDDKIRARQNIIHEAGLFQGRLGFNKAVIVMKENVEMPSNLDGIQQIRYTDNIKETISEILATISREFS